MNMVALRNTSHKLFTILGMTRSFWLWFAALLVVVGLLLPLVYLGMRGFSADEQVWVWLLRAQTLELIGRSLGLAGAVSLASIVLSVPLAWLVTRSDLAGKRFWSTVLPLPLVIPSYVGAYLYLSAFGSRGLLQSVLEGLFGVQRLPDISGFWGSFLVLTLMSYPYIFLTVRAALLRSDRSVEEAARSLGNTPWQTFWRAVFPLLRPAIAAGSLLTGLYVLRDFGAVSILRYTTFTRAIYIQYQSSFDRAGAALLALVLVAVTIGVLYFELRLNNRQNLSSPQTHKPPPLVRLGRWRIPATLFILMVLLLALVLPAGMLGYWLVRGLAAGEQVGDWVRPLINSLLAAGFGSVASLLAALPLAILAVRHPGRASSLLERFSYIGFALPGVVIALALVFFGANFMPWAYQTLAMLVFAYVILFLPQGVGSVRASLLQVHKNVEEAGHSLGAGPLRVFIRVTLPLVWPGVASGMALIFLTVMKELPATLILSPTGFPTLATQIWSAVSEAFFARAAFPALLIILISSLPLAVFNLYSAKRGSSYSQ